MAEINEEVIKKRIDELNKDIKEENLVRGNYIELINKLENSVTQKIGAINEFKKLIRK